MSNGSSRGGGGSNRREPPESAVQEKLARIRARRAERQAARAAGYPDDAPEEVEEAEDDESTQAINLADFDLDAPAPRRAAAPAPAAPARGRAPAPPPAAMDDDDDDDGDEKTAAFNIDALGDLLTEPEPAPAPAKPVPTRPGPHAAPRAAAARSAAPAPPAAMDDEDEDEDGKTAAFSLDDMGDLLKEPAPAPARAAAPPAAPPAHMDDDDDDGDGKTAAFSLDDMGDLLKEPAPAPARPAARSAAPPAHVDEDEDDGEGKTAAFSLDDMGDLLHEAPRAPAPAAPAAEEFERTQAVNLDDFEAQLPPPPSRGGGRSRQPEPEPAPEPPTLTVVVGNDIGKSYELSRDVSLVGRGMDADCVINDASASRRHFNIVRTSGGWKLVDLGSGNGTKVDGHRVQEIPLKSGMTIECGTTTLEFRDPAQASGGGRAPDANAYRDFEEDDGAEKTRMGDMAALEIDPDWEQRRTRARQEQQQGFETVAEPVGELVAAKKKGGTGKVLALVGGLVLLGGGGFVAADKFGGLGIIFPKEAVVETSGSGGDGGEGETTQGEVGGTANEAGGTTAAGGAPTADAKKKAKDLVLEGEAAYVEKRWYEAKKFFKEALEINPKAERENGVPVDEAVVLVDQQLDAWNTLVDAKKAASEERFADALELLKKIKVETAYHKDAQELIPTVRDDLVAKSLGLAREAEEKGDYEAAKKAVTDALAASKDDPDALAMQVALERATAPDADNLETDDEDPAKRVQAEKVAKIDFKPGFAKYAASDFMGAIDFFDGVTYGKASRRDKAKAKAVAGAITKFDTVLRAGRDALAAGKLDKALDDLRLAKKYDQAVNGAFQGQINKDLGKTYAALAKDSFDKKNLTSAGSYAKKALAVDPGNADMTAMMGDVLKTARSWIEDAKAAAESNPDKAMSLLSKALNVLPVDDESYKAAYALLNKIGSKLDE